MATNSHEQSTSLRFQLQLLETVLQVVWTAEVKASCATFSPEISGA